MTIECPICKVAFPVPSEVVRVDAASNTVWLRMDRTELYGHLQACAAEQGDKAGAELVNGEQTRAMVHVPRRAQYPKDRELVGRIHQLLDGKHYVGVGGSRACTMCGVKGAECLERLRRSRKGCCALCENGNTHPVPQESVPCATWGTEHGARA